MELVKFKDEPSEETPLDQENLNLNFNYSKINKSVVVTEAVINQNTDYKIPLNYKVGDGVLEIYFENCKLAKDQNYVEVGNQDSVSDRIQFKDWNVPVSSILEFRVHGDWVV